LTGEYYKTKESVDEYIEMAKDVNGSQLIAQLKQVLPLNSKLLEIGSGPGSDWEILNEFYSVSGSDNSPEFLNHLKANYPKGEFYNLDAVSINTSQTFDGIYSNKVLHHLNDVELKESIERQSEILNTYGIICHSFWKGTGSEVFKGLYVNYHDEEKLDDFFKGYFEILSITSYAEFEEGDSILLIGRKK
jgi:trans-aconitate methyltransferase